MKSLRLMDRYKSLFDLTWTEIPDLAIVTGLNGAGKTQLLEATIAAVWGSSSLTAVPASPCLAKRTFEPWGDLFSVKADEDGESSSVAAASEARAESLIMPGQTTPRAERRD